MTFNQKTIEWSMHLPKDFFSLQLSVMASGFPTLRRVRTVWWRVRARCLGLLVIGCLSGCQSEQVLESAPKEKPLKPPPSLVEETFGRGNSEITLLLPKARNGFYEGAARDIRDGAALAIGELDETAIMKVKIIDISAGPAAVAPAIAAAKGRGSVLIVSFAPEATTAAIAAIPVDQRAPLLNLSQPVFGPQVFNFGMDEVSSAVKGARSAISSGHKKIAVLAPASFPGQDEERLKRMVAQTGGAVTGVARYDPSAAAVADILVRNKSLFDNAGAAILMGEGADVGTALKGLRTSYARLAVVGTSSWPHAIYADPAAADVIVAAFDPEGFGLIGERYGRYNHRPLSIHAAHGYDSIAVAAGIMRGKGPAALTAEALTNKTGFRGVTGLFRFTKDGALERKLGLYKIEGGHPVAMDPRPVSF
ncbi:type 1 periplasmic-binding domain-containing protein [Rhizobium terrae]|uniref:hypothetical protein n=1 Tax=Rhizobium terrae TaxID=2171756 RepID=UPI000E3D30CB|nr:hypothetical protein [Rhizobium terrae]